ICTNRSLRAASRSRSSEDRLLNRAKRASICTLHLRAVEFCGGSARKEGRFGRGGVVYTNINVDPNLMDQAMRVTGLRTKTKVVEAALRALLLLHEQREIRDLRGRLHWQGAEDPTPVKGRGRAHPR